MPALSNRPKTWRYGHRPKSIPAAEWITRVSVREAEAAAKHDPDVSAAIAEHFAEGRKLFRELVSSQNAAFATRVKGLIPDFDPGNWRHMGRLVALLTTHCNLRPEDFWNITREQLDCYIVVATEGMQNTKAVQGRRSAPMSKAELTRRIYNNPNVRPRAIDWARFDLQSFGERKFTISLTGMDNAMRDRLEK